MNPRSRPTNVAASVRARLHNLARARRLEFQLALSDFAIERFLYRLGISPHAGDFVLKGAMLFRLWNAKPHRATWDLDLLGRAVREVGEAERFVREVCAIPAEDGITFELESVRGEVIRAAAEEAGIRLRFVARLADARIPMQIDVGFGDTVIPDPIRVRYPTLLDHPAPTVLAYPPEAVVAEKLEAMISLGVTNSRMKDFYDVYVLASSLRFDGAALTAAISATCTRRGTTLPGAQPLVLTPEFLASSGREPLWRAFLKRGRLEAPATPTALAEALGRFYRPVLAALSESRPFDLSWEPGGPWR